MTRGQNTALHFEVENDKCKCTTTRLDGHEGKGLLVPSRDSTPRQAPRVRKSGAYKTKNKKRAPGRPSSCATPADTHEIHTPKGVSTGARLDGTSTHTVKRTNTNKETATHNFDDPTQKDDCRQSSALNTLYKRKTLVNERPHFDPRAHLHLQ